VAFRELREDKDFFDVTLACDEEQIQAHKVILAACSPFFRGVLKRNPHAHPLLYLKGVKYADLVAVLSFMYHGEVNVAQEDLNSFLAVAEELKVKGLTQGDQQTSKPPTQKRSSQPEPPPPKRPRPPPPPVAHLPAAAEEDDDVQEVEMPAVKAEPQQFQQQQEEEAGQHSLASVEEGYEEGYEEDYGQYEEGYGMVGQAGAEGNKGMSLLSLALSPSSYQSPSVPPTVIFPSVAIRRELNEIVTRFLFQSVRLRGRRICISSLSNSIMEASLARSVRSTPAVGATARTI
jgi:hypothetical protein